MSAIGDAGPERGFRSQPSCEQAAETPETPVLDRVLGSLIVSGSPVSAASRPGIVTAAVSTNLPTPSR
ncbi:hypothetical protein GCM10009551_034510 [Nocardiopsis tropica]